MPSKSFNYAAYKYVFSNRSHHPRNVLRAAISKSPAKNSFRRIRPSIRRLGGRNFLYKNIKMNQFSLREVLNKLSIARASSLLPPRLKFEIIKFSKVCRSRRLRFFSIRKFNLKHPSKSALFGSVKRSDAKPLRISDFPFWRHGTRFNRYAYKSAALKFVSSSGHLRATYGKVLSRLGNLTRTRAWGLAYTEPYAGHLGKLGHPRGYTLTRTPYLDKNEVLFDKLFLLIWSALRRWLKDNSNPFVSIRHYIWMRGILWKIALPFYTHKRYKRRRNLSKYFFYSHIWFFGKNNFWSNKPLYYSSISSKRRAAERLLAKRSCLINAIRHRKWQAKRQEFYDERLEFTTRRDKLQMRSIVSWRSSCISPYRLNYAASLCQAFVKPIWNPLLQRLDDTVFNRFVDPLGITSPFKNISKVRARYKDIKLFGGLVFSYFMRLFYVAARSGRGLKLLREMGVSPNDVIKVLFNAFSRFNKALIAERRVFQRELRLSNYSFSWLALPDYAYSDTQALSKYRDVNREKDFSKGKQSKKLYKFWKIDTWNMNTVKTATQVTKYFGKKSVMPLTNLFASDYSTGSFGTLVQANRIAVTRFFDTLLAINADLGGLIGVSDFGAVVNKAFGFYRVRMFKHLIRRKTAQAANPFRPTYAAKLYSSVWALRRSTNYLTNLLIESNKNAAINLEKMRKMLRTRWWFSDKNVKRLQIEKEQLAAKADRRRRTAGGSFLLNTRPLARHGRAQAKKNNVYRQPKIERNSDGLPLFQDGNINWHLATVEWMREVRERRARIKYLKTTISSSERKVLWTNFDVIMKSVDADAKKKKRNAEKLPLKENGEIDWFFALAEKMREEKVRDEFRRRWDAMSLNKADSPSPAPTTEATKTLPPMPSGGGTPFAFNSSKRYFGDNSDAAQNKGKNFATAGSSISVPAKSASSSVRGQEEYNSRDSARAIYHAPLIKSRTPHKQVVTSKNKEFDWRARHTAYPTRVLKDVDPNRPSRIVAGPSSRLVYYSDNTKQPTPIARGKASKFGSARHIPASVEPKNKSDLSPKKPGRMGNSTAPAHYRGAGTFGNGHRRGFSTSTRRPSPVVSLRPNNKLANQSADSCLSAAVVMIKKKSSPSKKTALMPLSNQPVAGKTLNSAQKKGSYLLRNSNSRNQRAVYKQCRLLRLKKKNISSRACLKKLLFWYAFKSRSFLLGLERTKRVAVLKAARGRLEEYINAFFARYVPKKESYYSGAKGAERLKYVLSRSRIAVLGLKKGLQRPLLKGRAPAIEKNTARGRPRVSHKLASGSSRKRSNDSQKPYAPLLYKNRKHNPLYWNTAQVNKRGLRQPGSVLSRAAAKRQLVKYSKNLLTSKFTAGKFSRYAPFYFRFTIVQRIRRQLKKAFSAPAVNRKLRLRLGESLNTVFHEKKRLVMFRHKPVRYPRSPVIFFMQRKAWYQRKSSKPYNFVVGSTPIPNLTPRVRVRLTSEINASMKNFYRGGHKPSRKRFKLKIFLRHILCRQFICSTTSLRIKWEAIRRSKLKWFTYFNKLWGTLDSMLWLLKFCKSRLAGVAAIKAGLVRINTVVCYNPKYVLKKMDVITFDRQAYTYLQTSKLNRYMRRKHVSISSSANVLRRTAFEQGLRYIRKNQESNNKQAKKGDAQTRTAIDGIRAFAYRALLKDKRDVKGISNLSAGKVTRSSLNHAFDWSKIKASIYYKGRGDVVADNVNTMTKKKLLPPKRVKLFHDNKGFERSFIRFGNTVIYIRPPHSVGEMFDNFGVKADVEKYFNRGTRLFNQSIIRTMLSSRFWH